MKHLIIRNIGPITDVDIELKRINLLIGLQSSGKSTVNKIACYCSWVEKEISTAQSPAYFEKKGVFENRLVVFHKLEKFIHPDAYIEYETDVVRFSFSKPSEIFRFEWKDRWRYIRPKTIYIPSERNIVATIPNWFDVKLEENNIRSFMSDWEEARSYYAGTPIGILNLGVNYSFEKTNRHDTIRLKNQQTIDFTNASSGLQSIVPLLVILRYVTKGVYNEKKKESVSLETIHNKLIREIYNEMKRRFNERGNSTGQLNENALSVAKGNQIYTFYDKKDVDYFNQLTSNFMFPQYSNIFLEEPELNLYPTTQRELMNYLAKLTNDKRRHNVFITTHSPYLLTSLNNLLYAAKVGMAQKDAVKKIVPLRYWIKFEDVGAWFVKNGKLSSILDKDLQQIKAEKIDEVSRQLDRDYDKLMNLEYEAD
ncbi:AAA family ATPase [Proteiniphilum sp.]|uniref:AAA family ATPase n=1 Tax=Proteiniphilum sp. TaxID=1926877 RepID=UPI003323C96B